MIFVAIGIAFMVLAQEYRMGTAARMGPGYFPTLLGGLLAVLGLTLAVPALIRDGEAFPTLHHAADADDPRQHRGVCAAAAAARIRARARWR